MAGPLLLGAILQLVGVVAINFPYGTVAWCGFTLPAVVVVVVSAAFIKNKIDLMMTLLAAALAAMSVVLIFLRDLAMVGLGFLWASPFILIVVSVKAWTRSRRIEMAVVDAYAVCSIGLPLIGWWGVPMAFGLVFAAGVFLAVIASESTKAEGREKDLLAFSTLVTLLSGMTFAHWVYGPEWNLNAVARVAVVVATVYAFVLVAGPVSRRTRAEFSAVLGTAIMALSVPTVMTPSLVGWTADLAGYLVILGAGLVFLANRIHKLDNVWVQVCLGLGLFMIVISLAELATNLSSIPDMSKGALLVWAVAGAAVCLPRLVKSPDAMLASTRTGAIAAIGTAVTLAGVYMLIIDMGVEGAVEVVLGTPLIGYAVLRSGAPWKPKLAMCGLLMAAVGLTWASIIAEFI